MSEYGLFGLYLVMAVAIVCLVIKCLSLNDDVDYYKGKIEWYRVEWNNMASSNDLLEDKIEKLEKEASYRSNAYRELEEKYKKDEEIIESIKSKLVF